MSVGRSLIVLRFWSPLDQFGANRWCCWSSQFHWVSI